MIIAITVLTLLTVWLFFITVLQLAFNKDKPINKLKYFDENYKQKESLFNHKNNKLTIIKHLSNLIPSSICNSKKGGKLESELIKADLPITAEELLVIKLISSAAFSFLAYAIFKDYFMVLLIFFLIWNIPKVLISRRKKERIKLFDSQLGEGINIISNSLKAGYSFLQAVAVVAEETTDPFSKEFKKLLKEMSLGIAEEDALSNLLFRMDSEDLKLVINAIMIQKDIGGNLSEILDNISETIRDRQKIKGELKTLTAQGRLSGIIVMMIPILLGMTIYLFNKDYIMLLFTTPQGLIMLIAAVISQFLGFLMIRKIVNIEI